MMPKKALVVLCIIFSVGCARTTTRVYKDYFKNYTLNAVTEVNVGSPMISYTDITYIERKEFVGLMYAKDGWRYSKRPTADSFKEELIYTGRSGSTIHISYREYKENFARPAFYQQLTYDLKDSDTIVFRNYRMKVLEATNQYIRFKVIAD